MPIGHITYKETRDLATSAGMADHNDQVKKIISTVNGMIDQINAQGAAIASAAIPTISPSASTVEKPSAFKQFMQKWLWNNTVVNNDVREVNVNSPLVLQRMGANRVDLSLGGVIPNATFLPASLGGWTSLNEVMPIDLWVAGLKKIRVEARFSYNNSARGIFFRVSPNPTNVDGSDFVIEANSNGTALDTTKWCLKMLGVNEVTFPAPSKTAIHQIVVEFDGTLATFGKTQWNVWIDGVLQTLTNVMNNNAGNIPHAMRLTWGSNYSDPTFGTSASGAFPPLIFDGVIAERRVFTNITGSYDTPPSYSNLMGWWDTNHITNATYIDIGTCAMSQSSSGQPLVGSSNIYLATGNSVVLLDPDVAPNLSGLIPITNILTHGFPGSLALHTTPISQPIPHYNVVYAVITPNVARMKNLAFPDEDRYDLFHIPVANANPLVYPATPLAPIHTLRGLASPEQFIGASQ